VLVDPPSEWIHMNRRQARMVQGAVQLSRIGGVLARVGIVRGCLALLTGGVPAAPRHFVKVFGPTTARTLERLVGEVRKLPPELHPMVQALWCQPKCFRAMADHLEALGEATAAVAEINSLGNTPVVVISSRDQPPDVSAAHRALANLSAAGRVVVASKSGHWVPYDEPDLIAQAIGELVDVVRRRWRKSGNSPTPNARTGRQSPCTPD
jgi:pimeloyl-ACP methyl ester carboxylesterase